MPFLQSQIKIGAIHFFTQAVVLLVATKGMALLFLQALAETNGWVMLGLWLFLNFIVIAVLATMADVLKVESSPFSFLLTCGKVLALALLGAFVSYLLHLIYYRYHFYSIDREFNSRNFEGDFRNFMTYVAPVIILAELIRRAKFLRR